MRAIGLAAIRSSGRDICNNRSHNYTQRTTHIGSHCITYLCLSHAHEQEMPYGVPRVIAIPLKTLTTSSNLPSIDSHGMPPALPSSADPELHLRSRSRLLSRLSSLAEVPPEGWVRFPQSCGEGPPPPKAQKIQWSPAVVTKGKLESGGLERVESQCDPRPPFSR